MPKPSFSFAKNPLSILFGIIFPVSTLLFAKSLIDPASLPRLIAMSLVVILGFALIWFKEKEKPLVLPPRLFLIAIGLYLFMGAISLLNARIVSEALFDLANLVVFVLFLLLGFQALVREKKAMKILATGICYLGLFQALIGILQYFEVGFTFYFSNQYPAGTFVNKNVYAEMLLMCLPFALWSIQDERKWMKAVAVASVSLVLISLGLALSRGVILGLVGGIFLVGPLIWRASYDAPPVFLRKKILIPAYVLGFVLMLGLGYVKAPGNNAGEKLVWVSQEGKAMGSNVSSIEERLILWNRSLDLAQKHPITGVGLRNWKIEIMQYGVKGYVTQYATKYFKRPHNDYLWILCETGIPGLLGYLAFLFLPVLFALRIIKKSKSRSTRLTAALMLFGMIGFMIVSFFAFPKERIVTNGLFMLQIAVLLALYQKEKPEAFVDIIGKGKLLVFVFMLIAGGTIFISRERVRSEVHVSKVMEARTAQNWEKVIREVDKGKSWYNPLEGLSGTPLAWYRGLGSFSLGRYAEAKQDFSAARDLHPWHPHVMNNQATSFEVNKEHQKAIDLYLETLALYPDFEDVSLNLAAVYFNQNRHEDALEVLCGFEPKYKQRERKQYLDIIKNAMGMAEGLAPCE